jgi:hypothetical protein
MITKTRGRLASEYASVGRRRPLLAAPTFAPNVGECVNLCVRLFRGFLHFVRVKKTILRTFYIHIPEPRPSIRERASLVSCPVFPRAERNNRPSDH